MTYPLQLSARLIRPFIILLLLSAFLHVAGQAPSPQPGTYVNDMAKVLVPEDVADLNGKIRAIEEKYGVQLAIVLVQKLPDTVEIEDFALSVGREWHVGTDRKGLVYVASIGQHKQRLEVAANLEGDIPDVTAHAITDDMKPLFRNKDYAGALRTLVAEVEQHLPKDTTVAAAAAPAVPAAPAQDAPPRQSVYNSGAPSIFQWLVMGLIVLSIPLIVGLVRLFGGRSAESYAGSGFSSGGSDWGTNIASSDSSGFSGDSGSSSDSSSSSSDSGFDGGGSSNDW